MISRAVNNFVQFGSETLDRGVRTINLIHKHTEELPVINKILLIRLAQIISVNIVSKIPSLNFKINSILPEYWKMLFVPIGFFIKIVNNYSSIFLPKYTWVYTNFGREISLDVNQIIANAYSEEIIFRKLIQQIALPIIAQKMPAKLYVFLNHKWTRITLTAILFTLAHTDEWNYESAFRRLFSSGIVDGLIAENYGIFWSGFYHSCSNIDAYNGIFNGTYQIAENYEIFRSGFYHSSEASPG